MPFANTKAGRAKKKRYTASIKNKKVYEGMRKRGHSKAKAAAIANAGKTKAGRKRMAKRAAATRARKKK